MNSTALTCNIGKIEKVIAERIYDYASFGGRFRANQCRFIVLTGPRGQVLDQGTTIENLLENYTETMACAGKNEATALRLLNEGFYLVRELI